MNIKNEEEIIDLIDNNFWDGLCHEAFNSCELKGKEKIDQYHAKDNINQIENELSFYAIQIIYQ